MKNNIISAFGAFLCISALAYLNSFEESNLWLIPPFGASVVLVMAAHESPLAHPKNVLFGHILSASAGVFCLLHIRFFFSQLRIGSWVSNILNDDNQDCSSTRWGQPYNCCSWCKRDRLYTNASCSGSIFYSSICNYL